MGTLVRLAEKLEEKKSQAGKLKRKTERELKKSKFLQRVSVSGLSSIERKIDWGRENLSDVSGILTQKLAQQESVQRLLLAAEERLNHPRWRSLPGELPASAVPLPRNFAKRGPP